MLRTKKHHALVLQLLWDAYGQDAFAFGVVEIIEHAGDLIPREQFHLDQTMANGRARLLNGSPTAGSSRGRIATEESKRKVSEALKGRPKTPEHAAKVGARHKGKFVSVETRALIRAARLRQEDISKLGGLAGRGRPKSDGWKTKARARGAPELQSAEARAHGKESKRETFRIRAVHAALHGIYK